MKRTHYFVSKHDEGWKVVCTNTGGDFSTVLWKKGKIQQQTCPCCKETINK